MYDIFKSIDRFVIFCVFLFIYFFFLRNYIDNYYDKFIYKLLNIFFFQTGNEFKSYRILNEFVLQNPILVLFSFINHIVNH